MDEENRMIPGEEDETEEENALTEGDIIEMIDDDGNTVPFVFVDALEFEGEIYLALTDQEEDDAVFFLKIEQDDDGNDVYTAPDESLEDKLFEQFSRDRGIPEDE